MIYSAERNYASEHLNAVSAVPSFASGKGVDIGAFLNRPIETYAVAKAIPRFGTDEGGVLSLWCPEEPSGCAALHAGQRRAVGTVDGGSRDLVIVEDKCFVGKSIYADGHVARPFLREGETLGLGASLRRGSEDGLGPTLQGNVAADGTSGVVVGEIQTRMSAHLEVHCRFAQVLYAKLRNHLATHQLVGDADAAREGKLLQLFLARRVGKGDTVVRLVRDGPRLLAHESVLRHGIFTSAVAVGAIPATAAGWEKNGIRTRPKLRVALPQVFRTCVYVFQTAGFCSLNINRQRKAFVRDGNIHGVCCMMLVWGLVDF